MKEEKTYIQVKVPIEKYEKYEKMFNDRTNIDFCDSKFFITCINRDRNNMYVYLEQLITNIIPNENTRMGDNE